MRNSLLALGAVALSLAMVTTPVHAQDHGNGKARSQDEKKDEEKDKGKKSEEQGNEGKEVKGAPVPVVQKTVVEPKRVVITPAPVVVAPAPTRVIVRPAPVVMTPSPTVYRTPARPVYVPAVAGNVRQLDGILNRVATERSLRRSEVRSLAADARVLASQIDSTVRSNASIASYRGAVSDLKLHVGLMKRNADNGALSRARSEARRALKYLHRVDNLAM